MENISQKLANSGAIEIAETPLLFTLKAVKQPLKGIMGKFDFYQIELST